MLYVALFVCALAGTAMVYRYDMYEREPWYMIALALLAGFGAMVLMGYVEPWTLDLVHPRGTRPAAVIGAVAATHEEGIRLLLVVALALFVPRQFNDPMDGLVYGSVIGLGMAFEESLFFVDMWGSAGPLPPPTELVRFCGHLVMGGLTGFGVGLARGHVRGWPIALALTFGFSATLHFLWDWLAFTVIRVGAMTPMQTAASVALMGSGMAAYATCVVIGSRHSRRIFAPESDRRPWGWPFARRKPER